MGALIELLDRKLAKCPTPSLFLSPTNKVSKGFLKHPHTDAFGDKVIQEAGTQPGTHDCLCVCVCVCLLHGDQDHGPLLHERSFHNPLATAASVLKLRGTRYSLGFHKNPTCYLKICSEHTSLIN